MKEPGSTGITSKGNYDFGQIRYIICKIQISKFVKYLDENEKAELIKSKYERDLRASRQSERRDNVQKEAKRQYREKKYQSNESSKRADKNVISQASRSQASGSKRKQVNDAVPIEKLVLCKKRQRTLSRKQTMPPAELPVEYIAKDQDVLGDGFCGFRVIAFHILGNEEEHMAIKKNMLDYVVANRDYCHEHICGKNDEVLDELVKRLEYGISPESVEIAKTSFTPEKYWFNGMTDIQVAANTFKTPIACYSSHCIESHPSYLYLPHCKITDQKQPFVMHYVHDYHWRTFVLKGASEVLWPSVYNIRKQMHIWTDVLHLVETDQGYRSHWGYLRIKESPTTTIQYDLVETDDEQGTKPNSNDGTTQCTEATERNDEEILREGIENGYPESPDIKSIAGRVKEMKQDIDLFIYGKKRSLFAAEKDKYTWNPEVKRPFKVIVSVRLSCSIEYLHTEIFIDFSTPLVTMVARVHLSYMKHCLTCTPDHHFSFVQRREKFLETKYFNQAPNAKTKRSA
ncbi:hypothetical protein BJV82DRAFT_403883 [Fennellomyces sp. T-0311]|nr:hypothetical protein BJV82DRAFT_403883 [Fennellomyces sp. T-0311]